jgi:hypothetical protein
MTVDCARARSFLHPWLDGELERDEHRLVVEHLASCDPCDARFKDEQRLLDRVKTGLATPCPAALRDRIFADIAGAPLPARGAIISIRRFAAAAAVLAVAFVWTDPICLRGCPTVRALAQEHLAATPAIITSSTEVAAAFAQDQLGEPVPECEQCPCSSDLECRGVKAVTCSKKGCMVFYKDGSGRSISFVKVKDAHLHPWLRFRERGDGLIVTRQDGCRFACWKDGDGTMCGLVCDESMPQADLVTLSEKVRAH